MEDRSRGTGRRRSAAGLLLAAWVACSVALGATSAGASAADTGTAGSTDAEVAFVAAINASRSSLGSLPPLRTAPDLEAVAERHAAAMARRGSIFHNPSLTDEVVGWDVVGENVGVAPAVATLHEAFLGSKHHRANVLDVRYREVGVGVVRVDGKLWVAEVFRTPVGAVPADVLAAGAAVAAPALADAPPPRTVEVPAPGDAVDTGSVSTGRATVSAAPAATAERPPAPAPRAAVTGRRPSVASIDEGDDRLAVVAAAPLLLLLVAAEQRRQRGRLRSSRRLRLA